MDNYQISDSSIFVYNIRIVKGVLRTMKKSVMENSNDKDEQDAYYKHLAKKVSSKNYKIPDVEEDTTTPKGKRDHIIDIIGKCFMFIFFMCLGYALLSQGISENRDVKTGNIDTMKVTAVSQFSIKHSDNNMKYNTEDYYTKCRASDGDIYIVGGEEPVGETFIIYKPASSDNWMRVPSGGTDNIDQSKGLFAVILGAIIMLITSGLFIDDIVSSIKKKRKATDKDRIDIADSDKAEDTVPQIPENSELGKLMEALNMAVSAVIMFATMAIFMAIMIVFSLDDDHTITEARGVVIVGASIAAWFAIGFIASGIKDAVLKHITDKYDISTKEGTHTDSPVMQTSKRVYVISAICLVASMIVVPLIVIAYMGRLGY